MTVAVLGFARVACAYAAAAAIALVAAAAAAAAGQAAELPRLLVEMEKVKDGGRPIAVPPDGNLQEALDMARPGQRIELARGATYQGPFRLRRKDGSGWIVIMSAPSSGVPDAGTRIDPTRTRGLARLRSSGGPVIAADPGAHHYRLVGLDIAPTPGAAVTTLVQLGDGAQRLDELPHHIVFDRCYLHGDPTAGTRRGIALNARHAAVLDSYLADFKAVGADAQAVAGWNGPGPFALVNNFLEASGENVMFGGADPSIPDLVPADISVIGNHFAKPLRWMRTSRDYGGTPWTVKNLFELKNARRVLIDGNVFEQVWVDGQTGFAIVLTVRNQSGGAPWSVVEDVIFTGNVVRGAGGGINLLGRDDINQSQPMRRVSIHGNWFTDIGGQWGDGRLFQLLNGTESVAITNNTAVQTGPAVVADQAPHRGFAFERNVVRHNDYGIVGSGTGSGKVTLARYFPGAVVRLNVFVGGRAADYPPDNRFVSTLDATPGRGEGRPARDAGADLDALSRTASQVVSGRRPAVRPLQAGTLFPPLGSVGRWLDGVSGVAAAFWIALATLAYVYAGYPMLIWLRARWHPRRHVTRPSEPTVSIVMSAHNEGDRIDARIQNLLALDYPRDRVEILVGSDGSTDDTVERASRYRAAGVCVEGFREWRGKPAVLNALVAKSSAEVILFADARQRFDATVLRSLVAHFADPAVGAVSGELMLAPAEGAPIGQGTGFYWRYEKFIRLHESLGRSTVGATGAIYAIRRQLFQPIPHDIILDDVLIPMRIVRQGYVVRFEPGARAFDVVSATAAQECTRKVRTIAGMFQLFAREPWLLNPLRNPLWFETVSHKALRLTLPALHAASFLAAAVLAADSAFFQLALGGQLAFYGAAALGHVRRHGRRRWRVLCVPYAMCVMLWATVGGAVRFLRRSTYATWERSVPVARRAAAPPART